MDWVGLSYLKGRPLTPPPLLDFHAAALMADVYADHKDDDGFLYITYRFVLLGLGWASDFHFLGN